MSVVSNRYFSLNTLGSAIWDCLEQPRSLDEIVQSICENYTVEESVARADVTGFLDTLQSRKLIQLK